MTNVPSSNDVLYLCRVGIWWEMKKMPFTHIFSCFHNVFLGFLSQGYSNSENCSVKSQVLEIDFFCRNQASTLQFFCFALHFDNIINPFPNDKCYTLPN